MLKQMMQENVLGEAIAKILGQLLDEAVHLPSCLTRYRYHRAIAAEEENFPFCEDRFASADRPRRCVIDPSRSKRPHPAAQRSASTLECVEDGGGRASASGVRGPAAGACCAAGTADVFPEFGGP